MTFEEHMEHGGASLNKGHFVTAWWHFHRACRRQSASCEAHQLRGVCLRLLRLRSFAGAAFARAYHHARTDTQRAKVLRDDSPIVLAQGNYPLAIRQLKQAHKMLSSTGTPLIPEARREYWITAAYLGDAYRRAGDRKRAYPIILQAWAMLAGDVPYELNALVRLIAAERWYRRKGWLPLALNLASSSRKRRLQVRLICVNARLADLLFC